MIPCPGQAYVELLGVRLRIEILELAQHDDRRLQPFETADRGEEDRVAELAALAHQAKRVPSRLGHIRVVPAVSRQHHYVLRHDLFLLAEATDDIRHGCRL